MTENDGNIQAHVSEEKERKEIDESMRKFLVLSHGLPYLLPPNGEVVLAFGHWWSWPRLLKYEPPNADKYPVSVGSGEQ